MSLPPNFKNPSEYFEACLVSFQKYQYLFNFPNIDLLIHNALDKIEIEDLDEVDVFDKNFDLETLKSDYLKDFIASFNKLSAKHEAFINNDLELAINVPLAGKKKHEIANLAKEIEIICKETQCDSVIDFGSGLGYLDQQLFKTTNLKVLGIECCETNYIGAKKRQNKYHSDSTDNVKYVKHRITEDSQININNYLEDKFSNCKKFCIAGLHACADLTIDAINLFLKMEKAQALIIMPCCYHRILQNNNKFINFPLSGKLKEIYENYNGASFLRVPFLRLATQPPCMDEEKLDNLVFSLLARAVLQLYCYKHNCKIKRNKRKAVPLKSIENNFQDYIQNALTGFKIIPNQGDEENNPLREFNMDDVLQIWREIDEMTFKKAAIFIKLQNYLQPIFENFVLFDRLVYLQENGISNCRFKKIVDESISPRCFALLAGKL